MFWILELEGLLTCTLLPTKQQERLSPLTRPFFVLANFRIKQSFGLVGSTNVLPWLPRSTSQAKSANASFFSFCRISDSSRALDWSGVLTCSLGSQGQQVRLSPLSRPFFRFVEFPIQAELWIGREY